MRESCVKFLAWVLVAVFPASMLMADATSAMLRGSGTVSVNGSPIGQAMAVFPGDRIQTGANSMAMLTNEGSSVTVSGNASLVFSRSFVNVLCGTAMVSTSRGMSVRASNMLVQPARGVPAKFEVSQKEGQLEIIARDGTLAIDNGNKTSTLQPGQMLTTSANCMLAPYTDDQTGNSPTGQNQSQAQDQQQTQDKGRCRDRKKGCGAPPPPGGVNTSSALLYGAMVAGGATALILLTTRGSSASNTTPSGP